MPELVTFSVVLSLGVLAGAINTMVGGGTYIMLPVLVLFTGLTPQVANATNRLAVAFQAVAGTVTLRRRGVVQVRTALIPAGIALLGGVAGGYLNTRFDAEQFRSVMGWLLLGGIALLFVRPKRPATAGSAEVADPDLPEPVRPGSLRWPGLIGAFVLGVYGGFLGAGVGVLIMLVLPRLLGVDLVQGVAIKVMMVLAFSASAALVYVQAGLVDWAALVPVVVGYMIGGVLGARLAVKVGNRWLRPIVAIVGAVLAVFLIAGISF